MTPEIVQQEFKIHVQFLGKNLIPYLTVGDITVQQKETYIDSCREKNAGESFYTST